MVRRRKRAAVAESKQANNFQACRDHQGRTCLRVHEDDTSVKYIPLLVEGFEVHETSPASFYQRFSIMDGYPVKRICQHYLKYGLNLGATDEVLDYLEHVISISNEEREMATTKKAATKKSTKKTAARKPAAKKTTGRKAPAKKAPAKRSAGKTGKYASAAAMFKELIMAGKLTDDKIFEKVQAEFGLADNKRGYVKWYRNDLAKKGKKPPAAK